VITGNAYNALRAALQGTSCRVCTGNMQIKVPAAPPYRYPDLSVVCGPIDTERFNGNDLLLNPTLLVEVLSSTTEAYDRGDKFTFYKSIPSFCEYLLIAQHRPHIAQFVRQPDGRWLHTEVNEPGASLLLPSLHCTLALSDVYEGVVFA
jgi:Uma2 family endonuclease